MICRILPLLGLMDEYFKYVFKRARDIILMKMRCHLVIIHSAREINRMNEFVNCKSRCILDKFTVLSLSFLTFEYMDKKLRRRVASRRFSVKNIRSYTVSSIWLAIHEQNKDNKNRHAKGDKERPGNSALHRENYRLLKNAENRKNSLPQGRAHKLVV